MPKRKEKPTYFGYPKAVNGPDEPFKKVFSPQEEREYFAAKTEASRLEGELSEIERLKAENEELAANQKQKPGRKPKDDHSE